MAMRLGIDLYGSLTAHPKPIKMKLLPRDKGAHHAKLESTVRHLRIEVDHPSEIASDTLIARFATIKVWPTFHFAA